jgi:hypothetical protein
VEKTVVPVGSLLAFLQRATRGNVVEVGGVPLPYPVNPATFANARASHERLTSFANSVLKATVDLKRHNIVPRGRCVGLFECARYHGLSPTRKRSSHID